jgi:predicted transcriptional regulator
MVLTKLNDVLKNRGMTVEELAAKSMLSAKSIYNAGKGRGVSLNTAKRIAQSLKLSVSQLKYE